MRIKKSFIQLSFICMLLAGSFIASAENAHVITNQSVAVASNQTDIKVMLKKMYLRQLNEWPDGSPVKVYLPEQGSAALSWFYEQILEMSESEVAEYWLKLKQKTGETPHRQIASSSMLLKVVNQFEGAWGVVPTSEFELPDKVKIILSQ